MSDDPKYPEHEKLIARRDEKKAIESFLQWLEESGNRYVMERDTSSSAPWYRKVPERDLIVEYFGVDQRAFEAEKRAMLDDLNP